MDTMKELLTALASFQQEAVKITKDSKANYGKYVSLPKIIDELQPMLNKHGLLITQFPATTDSGEPGLTTILAHPESGETIQATAPLSMVKTDPQAQGSAITYMRRYSYAAVTQVVVDEDDDGQSASNNDHSAPTKMSGNATEKQVKMIEVKTDQLPDSARKAFGSWYKSTFDNKPFKALTKSEASKAIDKLMGSTSDEIDPNFDGDGLAEFSGEVF